MSVLSDVLRAAAEEHGWSAREVSRRARAGGFTMNHDTVARYLRGAHGQPDEITLEAFAAALSIPLAELRRAADLPSEVTEPYRPPREAARLTTRQRKAVDELIRAMTDTSATAREEHRRAARRGQIEGDEAAEPGDG